MHFLTLQNYYPFHIKIKIFLSVFISVNLRSQSDTTKTYALCLVPYAFFKIHFRVNRAHFRAFHMYLRANYEPSRALFIRFFNFF